MKTMFPLVALMTLLLAPGMLLAQSTTEAQRTQRDQQAERAPQLQANPELAEYLTAKLMLINDGAIQMAEIAQRDAKSSEVKQLAQSVIEEHRKLNQQIQEAQPRVAALVQDGQAGRHSVGYRGAEGDNSPRTQTLQRNESTAGRADAIGPFTKLLKINCQAMDNYNESVGKLLNKHDGSDFDMCYLGFQVGTHTWALSELEAMESIGDAKFQQLVSTTKQAVEQHLEQAKQLTEKLAQR